MAAKTPYLEVTGTEFEQNGGYSILTSWLSFLFDLHWNTNFFQSILSTIPVLSKIIYIYSGAFRSPLIGAFKKIGPKTANDPGQKAANDPNIKPKIAKMVPDRQWSAGSTANDPDQNKEYHVMHYYQRKVKDTSKKHVLSFSRNIPQLRFFLRRV